ncbi:MAG: cytochrome c biogenesis protein [Proteobacteria bacterium]|nr:cytochrome c biogenesis protein [Pseudomonadota bacterium]MBU1738652.1 cytochrome c biogenesis protein [Pseudomonadota bacterium]
MLESLDPGFFQAAGRAVMAGILAVSVLLGFFGGINLFRAEPFREKECWRGLVVANLLFLSGFLLICWLHLKIHSALPLELPPEMADWLNRQLAAANRGAAYGLPLYEQGDPPRYAIPLWIENEKYFFWFLCYSAMALFAWRSLAIHRFRGAILIALAIQSTLLYFVADPFAEPLPKFFSEITPWFAAETSPMARFGMFMKLYPRMIFYYNAHYMWLHPPMLFISYGCITITFITSLFMLVKRQPEIEKLGYEYAKLGYFMLTLGMLLGYPWALQAWGPNWWWDPKICSSIMMWAIYSTYLHTRLYANKPAMWYFSSFLGILCFAAMIFTFLTSFFFPGEHTFQ